MDNISMLIFAIVIALLTVWSIEGARLYKSYKGDIYKELFGGFIPYFFHYAVRKDYSVSGSLKQKIGMHRLIFSAIKEDGKTAERFCTIIYNRGIMVCSYNQIGGELIGKAHDKEWVIRRTDEKQTMHSYRYPNPTKFLEAYLRRIALACKDVHLEARMAVDNDSSFDNLKSDIKPIHYQDIVNELVLVQAEVIEDQTILDIYHKLMDQKD
ncbi:MAG: hypothetical protein EOM64_03360 [Erysipelotrichia bacterium]|nr:hypothetical protein [Erysipelotrichia bacterium]